MIAIDYSILVQIVAFLILWFLLGKLLFQPFLRLLEEREKRTEGAKEDTDAITAEGERLKSDYAKRMAKARDEAEAAMQAILAEAVRAREQILARARESAGRSLQGTRQQISRELQAARGLIGEESQAAAREIAEKIIGRKIA